MEALVRKRAPLYRNIYLILLMDFCAILRKANRKANNFSRP